VATAVLPFFDAVAYRCSRYVLADHRSSKVTTWKMAQGTFEFLPRAAETSLEHEQSLLGSRRFFDDLGAATLAGLLLSRLRSLFLCLKGVSNVLRNR